MHLRVDLYLGLSIIEHNKAANSLEALNKLKEVLKMSNSYEQKQAAKKERYLEMADNARSRSNAGFNQASDMAKSIPFGQPILVGHHSEKRDRNFRARITNNFDKAFAEQDKANHYEKKAARVGTGGVSSDDPDAVVKLKEQLVGLEKAHETMKKTNALIRKYAKLDEAEQVKILIEQAGLTEKQAINVLNPAHTNTKGFASYALTNNNANIRRIKKRIETLEAKSKRENKEVTGAGYVYREDVEDNRVMFIFDGKPSEAIREVLKCQAFKWSPSRGAWVRMLNNAGLYAAEQVVKGLAQAE